jgi:hypothetical protein
MKRLLAMSTTLMIAIVLVPTASAGRARIDEQRYNYFDASPQGRVGGRLGNAVEFETYSDERFMRVEIVDQTERSVSGEVRQDPDGDGKWALLATFCGATERAVRIRGGLPVRVRLEEGPCEDGGALIGSSGTVEGAFTR